VTRCPTARAGMREVARRDGLGARRGKESGVARSCGRGCVPQKAGRVTWALCVAVQPSSAAHAPSTLSTVTSGPCSAAMPSKTCA